MFVKCKHRSRCNVASHLYHQSALVSSIENFLEMALPKLGNQIMTAGAHPYLDRRERQHIEVEKKMHHLDRR